MNESGKAEQRRESREFTGIETAFSPGVSTGSSHGKGKEMQKERNVDSRTHKTFRAPTQSSAGCLAFVTILGQPGSSSLVSKSPA